MPCQVKGIATNQYRELRKWTNPATNPNRNALFPSWPRPQNNINPGPAQAAPPISHGGKPALKSNPARAARP
jgi:hypothetical protein